MTEWHIARIPKRSWAASLRPLSPRPLIKIAFNSARAQRHDDAELLGRYRPLMLAVSDSCPLYVNVYIALIGPGTLEFGAGRDSRKIYPRAARSGPIIIPDVNGYQRQHPNGISSRLFSPAPL